MRIETFKAWLDKLVDIWESKKPSAVAELCAEEFNWFETPFSNPITIKKDLFKEWESVLMQEGVAVSYNILCIKESTCFAHWTANFTRKTSKENVSLDGIFQVTLDKQGKCTEFRQWYNTKR